MLTLGDRVARDLELYLNFRAPGSASGSEILQFWRLYGNTLPLILPGFRILLSWGAGNGPLERGFGHGRQTLGALRIENKLGLVILNQNGKQVLTDDYIKDFSDSDEDERVSGTVVRTLPCTPISQISLGTNQMLLTCQPTKMKQ